jgi:hypothetical protein
MCGCGCGAPIVEEDFEEGPHQAEYGFCPTCLTRELTDLIRRRDDYARTADVTVRRLNLEHIDLTGEVDDTFLDEDDPPYLRRLRRAAVFNAHKQRGALQQRAENRGDSYGSQREYRPNEDRAVVTHLRHNATNYDDLLRDLPITLSNHIECHSSDYQAEPDPRTTLQERVHTRLAEVYPEVADVLRTAD